MRAIIRKEINGFFSSPIGYLVIGVFLVINGLFLWVFNGGYNIFDNGFAELSAFFELAPWIFIFLIPAITMRTFSEEKRMGTLELLLTKPISLQRLILGKYVGALLLILLALLPTLLYIFTIADLGNSPGNWDLGITLGSYIGLFFLSLSFTGIGLYASTLSENQIIAFIVAVFLCFFMYYGFEGISSLGQFEALQSLGMQSHFKSVARGVLDTRDVLYFISVAIFFLSLTYVNLKKN